MGGRHIDGLGSWRRDVVVAQAMQNIDHLLKLDGLTTRDRVAVLETLTLALADRLETERARALANRVQATRPTG